MPSKPNLPGIYKGLPIQISDAVREKHDLAQHGTIIEVDGENGLEDMLHWLKYTGYSGLDVESTGLDPFVDKIVLLQMGTEYVQYLVWWETLADTQKDEILDYLENPEYQKIGTNLKFDIRFLIAEARTIGRKFKPRSVVDAMLLEQIIGCGVLGVDVGHTLKLTSMESMVERWFGIEIPKDEELRTGWGEMTPGDWDIPRGEEKRLYAADDVVWPIKLVTKQKSWVEYLGLMETAKLEMEYLPVLAEMEDRGIRIDLDKWSKLTEKARTEFDQAQNKIHEMFEIRQTIKVGMDGQREVNANKNLGSAEDLQDMIKEYMEKVHGIKTIASNKHLYNELVALGTIPQPRLDLLFTKGQRPHPTKKDKKQNFGYPHMTDYLEQYWPDVQHLFPARTLVLLDTDSKTLKLNKIIWETPKHHRDMDLPTRIGMPTDLVDPLLKWRKNDKILGTYGDNWKELVHKMSGRIHTDFVQAALTTGRNSSSPNLQNIPSGQEYRECFIPNDGFIYLGADWDQIEPRIIAELSGSPVYMRVFWSDHPGTEGYEYWCPDKPGSLDLYTEIGKLVGVLPKHFTKDDCKGDNAKPEGKKGRKQAKIIVLGLGYGTGIPKFWITLILDTEEHQDKKYAARLFNTFWEAVQEVKKALDEFSDLAGPKSRRKLWHPFVEDWIAFGESLGGRKRFFHPNNKGFWTEGRNIPIQATGADIMKYAGVRFTNYMWDNNFDGGIIITAHDEFIVEAREEDKDTIYPALLDIMRDAGQHYCQHVPITVAGYQDYYWVKD